MMMILPDQAEKCVLLDYFKYVSIILYHIREGREFYMFILQDEYLKE